MATATTALVRTAGTTGGAVMMMQTGNSIAMGCTGQPSQVPLYPTHQGAYSIYPSQTVGVSSANSRFFLNNSSDAASTIFFPQQQQQSYQLQRSFYQNLTPEPPATTTNNVLPQIMNSETVGSVTSAPMSNENLAASSGLTDLGSHSLSVLRPSSCSSRSRPSSSSSSATNVPIPIANNTVIATSAAGPVTKNMDGLVIASVAVSTATSGCATRNADILFVRDPFEEEELNGTRCNATNTLTMFNQRPPQYINTGNPLDSGGHLELPRHLHIPYPESAYRACIAANKNLDNYRNGAPLPSFTTPYPAYANPRPGSVFAPNIVAVDNSVMYGNPQQQRQQQQLPGNSANFGMMRSNGRAQGNASPGCPPIPASNAPAQISTQGFGNPYCVQGPAPTQQMLGPPGCIQRPEYLPAASGPYCMSAGGVGQSYFGGGQPMARPEPGTSGMMSLNNGPQMSPMGMMSMNGDRIGPVMGVIGVPQQQSVGMVGKKVNNKRSKGNKAVAAASNLSITDEQQLLAARRKQQSILSSGQQQQQPMVPGMMLPPPVSSQDFYLSQCISGSRSGMPPLVASSQQQLMIPLAPANGTNGGGGGLGQFDHFDVRPSTSISCTAMSCCPSIVSAPNTETPPQQQSTSQMIANSMMMTRGYGGFEQNGFVDGFQSQRSNGNSDTVNNNMTTNSAITTIASGDSFTVLNGSAGSQNTGIDNKQRCVSCTEEIRSDQPSIQCTANGDGCRRFFHQGCSGLLLDAFRAIIAEPCAEWICPDCLCRQQTQLTFA